MYINVSAPTRSIRTAPSEGGRLLLLGGEGHKTGEEPDTEGRYRNLEEFAREAFGIADPPAYRWSTQDYATVDRLPYVGRLTRRSEHVLVATGFGKWGMTNGTLAAQILADAVLGRPNPWASLYDSKRVKPVASARKFTTENAQVAAHWVGDRAQAQTLEELQPGDVLARGEYRLEAFRVAHGVSAIGYALVEEARPGRFDVAAADALGVPPGPERGALQRGEAVAVGDGRTVGPELVLGPERPGRKVVIGCDTAPTPSVQEAAAEADLLVHEATFADEERDRARETAHTTALQAAELARAADVELLALTHLSSRYFGPELAREAREVFPNTVVPKDFDTIAVPYRERGEPQLVKGGVLHRRPEREREFALSGHERARGESS